MLPDVREEIKIRYKSIRDHKKETLKTIQTKKIDIKKEWKCPVSAATMYNISQKENYEPKWSTINDVLIWLEIPYTEKYGIFQLIKLDQYGKETADTSANDK